MVGHGVTEKMPTKEFHPLCLQPSLTTAKEMGALSTYPPRKEFNNFMRHHELLKYVSEFAAERDLLRHFQFNTEVMQVKRSDDYEKSGKWVVTVRNTQTAKVTTDVYDGVIIGVGHINRPKIPTYFGQNTFKGQIMHTHSLRGVQSFQNKTVIVVGMGCSGLDAAVETSTVAKQVYLSTRSGAHVINRVGPSGYPYDYTLLRFYLMALLYIFPATFVSWIFETFYLDQLFNHKLYPVKPKHHILQKDPVLNDHISSKILSGYTWKFPFLEEGIIVQEEGKINLYKCMFPPHLPHASLLVIGFLLPFGPGFPPGELQCRWAAQVLAGNCKLPSQEVMFKDIKQRYETNLKRYAPCDKMSLRVDMVPYCNDIASQFGVKPNLLKILLTDPMLFFKLVFGPFLSYQFRLQGPYAWDGARDAIMTAEKRMLYPLTKGKSDGIDENIYINFIKRIVRFIFLW
ncbi:dimethylaniline monooxygenase 2 [Trichonephila inaurata madagascariensis]|uniref:Flavin-containing monooxygenase n=1 Tax=Trichonephila inaurata madagascariensis TaxID=2747483 RepID=A0A8X6XLT6_9ARAC|nr:dimethylaniline monooxygenase 2 [Trichonephila inaurata madagascariensis]